MTPKIIKSLVAFSLLSYSIHSTSAPVELVSATTCSTCHGVNGISKDPTVPHLAGQHRPYLTNQLKAFKSGKRKNPMMNAVASNLSETDITELAQFFSNQKKTNNVKAQQIILDSSHIKLEKDLDNYTYYTTVNRPDNGQVRDLFANKKAIETFQKTGKLGAGSKIIMKVYKAQKDAQGNLIKGKDGHFEKDKLAAYAVMENQKGWGDKIPAIVRNSDWNHAFFKASGEIDTTKNQGKCLACHQPISDNNYMFTFEAFAEKFAKNRH